VAKSAPDLTSVNLKLERAETHIRALRRKTEAFCAGNARVQPYAAANPPSDDPLAILHSLSNLDKHRLLVPVVAAVSETDSWVASENAKIRFTFIEPGPVLHDSRILTWCVGSPVSSLRRATRPSRRCSS
jgi:hypothetical protein